MHMYLVLIRPILVLNMQTGVKITTIGVGEGFGVSVYTADCMAKAGSSYEDIIETFYNKINIISE